MLKKKIKNLEKLLDNSISKPQFRIGTKVGRTIYSNDKLIGVMDNTEDAQLIVEVLNLLPELLEYIDQLKNGDDILFV